MGWPRWVRKTVAPAVGRAASSLTLSHPLRPIARTRAASPSDILITSPPPRERLYRPCNELRWFSMHQRNEVKQVADQDRIPVLVTGGAGYIGSHAVLA